MDGRDGYRRSPGSRQGAGNVAESGRIIIIDDNLYSAEMLEEMLQGDGHTVEKVSSGHRALEAIVQSPPDVILLDVRLPDTDAFALRRDLKQKEQSRDVPVIFMCAHDDAAMKGKGFEQGDDLITKPLEPREVLARVERQVTVSRVRTALRESEAKFQSVMESAIDAIISADVHGIIRAWNRAAAALFDYSPEEAIGQPLELIIPKQHHKAHQEGIRRVSSGGPSHVIGKTVELSAIRKGGLEFPIELSLATWFLDEDRYYTGIIRDISERKQAEQKFRSVTESAIDAIISADHEGNIVSWNSAATRILGYTAEEAVGQRLELIIPERHHEAHRTGMKRVTEGGESRVIGSTVELHARTKEGTEIPIELSLATWTVHDERYYTGIIRDISERKQAESRMREYAEELARQHEELKLAQSQLIDSEKQAMLGRLLAGLLHELNTPLGAMRSAADSISRALGNCREFFQVTDCKDHPTAKKAQEALGLGDELSGVVTDCTQRIEEIIKGLSHLITIDGSERKEYDLRDGIETVLSLLKPRIGSGIQLKSQVPAQPAMVHCERARLNQALFNIVENAITAVDGKGTISLSIKLNDDHVEVLIADDGCGMTPDQLAQAFEFSFTEKGGRVGLRLGLTTSRRTVEEHGGELTIDSEPDVGTKVRITLPRA
jgi:PAS domain S-box-containing protein